MNSVFILVLSICCTYGLASEQEITTFYNDNDSIDAVGALAQKVQEKIKPIANRHNMQVNVLRPAPNPIVGPLLSWSVICNEYSEIIRDFKNLEPPSGMTKLLTPNLFKTPIAKRINEWLSKVHEVKMKLSALRNNEVTDDQ
ncbi:unnamed protein product [Dicrocoelium dendriticum]|nr:unnamed protein product [Dicrocoelium dendriticum]